MIMLARITSLVRLPRYLPRPYRWPCLALCRLDLGAGTGTGAGAGAGAEAGGDGAAVFGVTNSHYNTALPIATTHLWLSCRSVLDNAAPVWHNVAATVSVRFMKSSQFRAGHAEILLKRQLVARYTI